MEKADPCARPGVISFGSCSLPQILGTNGLVVVVVVDDIDNGPPVGSSSPWTGKEPRLRENNRFCYRVLLMMTYIPFEWIGLNNMKSI